MEFCALGSGTAASTAAGTAASIADGTAAGTSTAAGTAAVTDAGTAASFDAGTAASTDASTTAGPVALMWHSMLCAKNLFTIHLLIKDDLHLFVLAEIRHFKSYFTVDEMTCMATSIFHSLYTSHLIRLAIILNFQLYDVYATRLHSIYEDDGIIQRLINWNC